MPLNVILLRHAKAESGDDSVADFERALAPRGLRDAARLGKWMTKTSPAIDVVVCSGSQRTRQTLDALRPSLKNARIKILESLYLAAPEAVLELIRSQTSNVRTILIVGHNPGFHELAVDLCGDSTDKNQLKALRAKFPTCTWCEISFATERWKGVSVGDGKLVRFLRARELGDDVKTARRPRSTVAPRES